MLQSGRGQGYEKEFHLLCRFGFIVAGYLVAIIRMTMKLCCRCNVRGSVHSEGCVGNGLV